MIASCCVRCESTVRSTGDFWSYRKVDGSSMIASLLLLLHSSLELLTNIVSPSGDHTLLTIPLISFPLLILTVGFLRRQPKLSSGQAPVLAIPPPVQHDESRSGKILETVKLFTAKLQIFC